MSHCLFKMHLVRANTHYFRLQKPLLSFANADRSQKELDQIQTHWNTPYLYGLSYYFYYYRRWYSMCLRIPNISVTKGFLAKYDFLQETSSAALFLITRLTIL